jgi:hypothetical protein
MTWYFFEAQNRELRTCPAAFGNARIIDFTWETGLPGKVIAPGEKLATVTFDGGAQPQVFLVAPPGCAGTVGRTQDLDLPSQAMEPSQLLLYLV